MKAVVFVCSEGRCRSPTAAKLFDGWKDARGRVWRTSYVGFDVLTDADWQRLERADLIVTMDAAQAPLQEAHRKGKVPGAVVCLNIHDIYPAEDPTLVSLLKARVPPVLNAVA